MRVEVSFHSGEAVIHGGIRHYYVTDHGELMLFDIDPGARRNVLPHVGFALGGWRDFIAFPEYPGEGEKR